LKRYRAAVPATAISTIAESLTNVPRLRGTGMASQYLN
jgi:hypothetical protein